MNSDNSKIIALIGSALLAIGTFLPLVRVPKMGTLNLIGEENGLGYVLLALAAAAAMLVLIDRAKHALWSGLAALALIAFTFVRIQSRLAEGRERLRAEIGDNPFRGLADAATNAVQLEYGWAVLVFGALLVTGGGALAWRRR